MKMKEKRKEIELIETLKKKKFIDAKMTGFIANKIVEVLGTNFAELVGKYDINMKDMIRFRGIRA